MSVENEIENLMDCIYMKSVGNAGTYKKLYDKFDKISEYKKVVKLCKKSSEHLQYMFGRFRSNGAQISALVILDTYNVEITDDMQYSEMTKIVNVIIRDRKLKKI